VLYDDSASIRRNILLMRTSDTRLKAMKNCKELAAKKFATEFDIITQMDEVYSELLDRIGLIPSKTYVQMANYGLAIRNYRLLHCAMDDLESGYYEVAMNLLRTVDECKNLMRYFAKDENKNEAKEWWFNKGEKGKKILSHGEVRNRLGISGGMNELYADFYAHAYDFRSLLPMVLDEKTEYHPYPYFIRDECYRDIGCWIDYANETIDRLLVVYKVEQLGDMALLQKVVKVQKLARKCSKKIASDLAKAAKVNDLQLPNDNQSSTQL
jgi:hypothetical protein